MLRPGGSSSGARRLIVTAAGVVVACALFVTCAAPRAQATTAPQAAPGALTLVWAASAYGLHEPDGAAVALHVVARNTSSEPTRSTVVRWSPEFVRFFSFLESSPPAANALVDGAGWGVVRLDGVPAGEEVEIGLWFTLAGDAEPPPYDLFPRLQVLVETSAGDGIQEVGEKLAVPLHAPERLKLEAQHAFDRSEVAQVVEHVPFVPVTARGVFGPAVSFAVLLLLVTGAGVATTIRAIGRIG